MSSFLFHEATSARDRRHFSPRITRKKRIPGGEGHIDQASRGDEREREREPQHVAAPLSWSITDQCARGNFREIIMSRSFGQPRSTARAFASCRGHARGHGRYINRGFRSNGNETATCRRRITCETTASSGILASVAVVLAASWRQGRVSIVSS